MAYITGTISDVESRAHQLITTTGHLMQFVTESRGYLSAYGTGIATGKIPPQLSGKWEKELRQNNFRIGHSGQSLLEQQL